MHVAFCFKSVAEPWQHRDYCWDWFQEMQLPFMNFISGREDDCRYISNFIWSGQLKNLKKVSCIFFLFKGTLQVRQYSMLHPEDVAMQEVVLRKPCWASLHDLRELLPFVGLCPLVHCHNVNRILLDSLEFQKQIASHEVYTSFHAVTFFRPWLISTTLETAL